MRSEYEWHQHRDMALSAGVAEDRLDAIAAWQTADCYSEQERVALMLTDAMLAGHVNDSVQEEVVRHFSDQERVELVATAGFYAMVPRVLDALRVPIEEDPTSAPTVGPRHDRQHAAPPSAPPAVRSPGARSPRLRADVPA